MSTRGGEASTGRALENLTEDSQFLTKGRKNKRISAFALPKK
jgi:hypothetical protein